MSNAVNSITFWYFFCVFCFVLFFSNSLGSENHRNIYVGKDIQNHQVQPSQSILYLMLLHFECRNWGYGALQPAMSPKGSTSPITGPNSCLTLRNPCERAWVHKCWTEQNSIIINLFIIKWDIILFSGTAEQKEESYPLAIRFIFFIHPRHKNCAGPL